MNVASVSRHISLGINCNLKHCGFTNVAVDRAVARMDDRNRALCFFFHNPPSGQEVTSDVRAQKLVFKKDGTIPSVSAIKEAADSFHGEKAPVGHTFPSPF